MTKSMVAQALAHQQAEMRATHQEIWVLEVKFKLFCREKFGIRFQERTKTTMGLQEGGS
jgi:hypothetical protein